ncbi:MAG: lysophospholipid acyltransferase family protein [Flavobacteriaceae bacterium]|nr:lysophospholipid acyltransferase family protein [Flavobacteriaceae bacterium]
MKKIFYNFICRLLRFYNRFYFRNLKVIGKENIPTDGAILFSPNHQNALIDPIMVGTSCDRSVHSLTRSDVFGGPWQWLLDAMQTLPVYRIRDGYEKLKNNAAVFEQCYALLGNKKHMMMFSEGKHHDQHYLQRLSKGSSRLAMQAQLTAQHTIYLQAVGLNYGNHLHAGHDCVVVYGKAIPVSDYVAAYQANAAKGLNALRDALQLAMEDCLWLPKNDEQYTERKKYINQHTTPISFKELKQRLNKENHSLKIASRKSFWNVCLIYLFALPNLPVHLSISFIQKQFDDHVFHGTMNYLGGLILFPLWWILTSSITSFYSSIQWGLALLLLNIVSLKIRRLARIQSL